MRSSDWSSDVCSSDWRRLARKTGGGQGKETAGIGNGENRNIRLDGVSGHGHGRTAGGGIRHETSTVGLAAGNGDKQHACNNGAAVGGETIDFDITHGAGERPVDPREVGSGKVSQFHRRYFLLRTARSEEHTSELQSIMRISYAVFC